MFLCLSMNDKKRILITSTDVMMYQFLLPHVCNLSKNGFIVDIACSYAKGYENEGYHSYIQENLPEESSFFSVSLCRSPFSLSNTKGLKEIKSIIAKGKYDLIWTNEPVMGVMTRLAARKARYRGSKVLYLAHGYQFFKGCPIVNWFVYPVEKLMAFFCDCICLINWEDYEFTQKHMKIKNCYHIDGIGLDTERFRSIAVDRKEKRRELGFGEDDIIVISVGELQKRKNHEPVIRAISQINDKRVKYLICGWGELKDYYAKLSSDLGISDRFFMLGHRYDVPEILKISDIFAHPSVREGLGIAAVEAMSAGLPLVTSNVQGIKDYTKDGITGYVNNPMDIEGYKNSLNKLITEPLLRKKMGEQNVQFAKKYDIRNTEKQILDIINSMLKNNDEIR